MKIECIKGPAITMYGTKYTAALVPENEFQTGQHGQYQGSQMYVDSYCQRGHMLFAQTFFADDVDNVYIAFVPFPKVRTERAAWMRDNYGHMDDLPAAEYCAQCFGRQSMDEDERRVDEFANLFNGDYDDTRDSYDTGLFFGNVVEKWFKKTVMECFGP